MHLPDYEQVYQKKRIIDPECLHGAFWACRDSNHQGLEAPRQPSLHQATWTSVLAASVLSRGCRCASPRSPTVPRRTGGRASFCLPPILPDAADTAALWGERERERNAELAATAVPPISRLNHPLREGRAAAWLCCEDATNCWKNLSRLSSALTFDCVRRAVVITESSASDSVVNGALIPSEYRTMWLHYTLCKLSVS